VYLLDTDHITLLEQGQGAECDRVRSRLAALSDRNLVVTIIGFEERTIHGPNGAALQSSSRTRLTRRCEDFASAWEKRLINVAAQLITRTCSGTSLHPFQLHIPDREHRDADHERGEASPGERAETGA
jgi:hypothetical protein